MMTTEATMKRLTERGDSNIGCLVGLVVLAVAVVVAIKIIPVKISVAEFKDFIVRQAEQASLPRHDDEVIATALLRKAQELRLPIGKEQIKVWRSDSMVYVEVKYRVVLNLLVTNYNWNIEEKVERNLFS
jgi:hypothetical protein